VALWENWTLRAGLQKYVYIHHSCDSGVWFWGITFDSIRPFGGLFDEGLGGFRILRGVLGEVYVQLSMPWVDVECGGKRLREIYVSYRIL